MGRRHEDCGEGRREDCGGSAIARCFPVVFPVFSRFLPRSLPGVFSLTVRDSRLS